MPTNKETSEYDLLHGKLKFTDEKPSVRILLFVILVFFYLALAFVLGKYALPALVLRGIVRGAWIKGLFQGKGLSP